MRYEDETLGYSFQLPDGWRVDKNIRPLTFFGPQGHKGLATQHIQIRTGSILPDYCEAKGREEFMAEPGATVRRSVLGEETNVVICEWHDHSEISAVRDGVQYSIVHPNDAVTLEAVKLVQATFQFPSTDRSAAILQRHSDPAVQTMACVMEAGSIEEARFILETSPALDSVENLETGTAYRLRQRDQRSEPQRRRWWQFWNR
jgi:hypothetical protein